MSDFRYVFEIRVSPARVWSVLLDVERWPEWTTSVTKVQRMDLGPLTLGSRTRIWQPRLMPAVWCVTSLDKTAPIFVWTTHSSASRSSPATRSNAIGAHSRVTLGLHYSGVLGPIMARFQRDLIWDYLAREGTGLRARCEAPVIQRAQAR